ncbi:MAG: ArsR family transcriptional regulator, partial [Actinobacteria bacterium]|nr:ArsR family transcriptional regulator [Actinomycetota bacterium]
MQESWTRRQVLRRSGAAAAGVAGLTLAGLGGYEWPRGGSPGRTRRAAARPAASRPVPAGGDIDYFVTRPDLHPPAVTVTRASEATRTSRPPYIFIAPRGYLTKPVGQSGLMILDRDGQLVWFGDPIGGTPLNFARQEYQGQPVLTWSAGYVTGAGVTFGTAYIADTSYRVIATVKAGNGAQTDLHDFILTRQGTALLTAHRKVPADLSSLGGPAKGMVWGSIAQEVD